VKGPTIFQIARDIAKEDGDCLLTDEKIVNCEHASNGIVLACLKQLFLAQFVTGFKVCYQYGIWCGPQSLSEPLHELMGAAERMTMMLFMTMVVSVRA
jgi:hypothetical protein